MATVSGTKIAPKSELTRPLWMAKDAAVKENSRPAASRGDSQKDQRHAVRLRASILHHVSK